MTRRARRRVRAVVRLACIAAAGMFLVGLHAGPADAGTASVVTILKGNTLRYVASAGEADGVVITVSGGTYSVFATPGVTAGSGCVQVNGGQVNCTATISRITVDLGDMDDFVQVEPSTATTLTGGDGNDTLIAGPGTGTLSGGNGDDILNGRGGADAISGGAGTDTATYASHSVAVVVTLDDVANDGASGEGDNVASDVENVTGGDGGDSITGDADANVLNGGLGNDTLNGGDGTDTLKGGPGNDTLNGGEHIDYLDGGLGADVINGGPNFSFCVFCPGGDTLDYSSRTNPVIVTIGSGANDGESGEGDNVGADVENILGGSGNDSLTGSTSNNRLIGNNGNDTLNGGAGNDFIDDGLGNDALSGGDGNDTLLGGLGTDTVGGGTGIDFVDYSSRTENIVLSLYPTNPSGAAGEGDLLANDIENGNSGSGDDTLLGNASDNVLDGGFGSDHLIGYGGSDTVDYSSRTNHVNIALNGGSDSGEFLADRKCDNLGHCVLDTIEKDVENAIGGSGDDLISGTASGSQVGNVLSGGPGNDQIQAHDGNDVLNGGPGDDVFFGDDDVSTIGADVYNGGSGIDSVSYGFFSAPQTITVDGVANDGQAGENDNVGLDVETVFGGSGGDSITGSAGPNTLTGGGGNDTLNGLAGDDTLRGGGGINTENGGDGNDTFIGLEGSDAMNGGAGIDTVRYSTANSWTTQTITVTIDGVANDGGSGEGDNVGLDVENVVGGRGNDVLIGSSAANVLDGDQGNDSLDGRAGVDTLVGGAGIDVASYSSRTNPVTITLDGVNDDGEPGENDVIGADVEGAVGGSGNDSLTGNAGANVLRGGPGTDTLNGLDGDDTLDGGTGADATNGGVGVDVADYSSRSNPVTVTLDGVNDDGETGENDVIDADVEGVAGGSGNDSLTGNAGANVLRGGPGTDTLNGLDGDDTLDGGTGADATNGGVGVDTADYSSRTLQVTASLDGVANDGQAGENDLIGTDVENVTGGAGNDALRGDGNGNVLNGGPGYDLLDGALGPDVLNGGADVDWADYSTRVGPVTASLDAIANDGESGESDLIGADVENVTGGSGGDTLTGDANANVLDGGLGNDLLDGGLGADILNGGGGIDMADYSSRTSSVVVSLDGVANDGTYLPSTEGDNVQTDVEGVLGGTSYDSLGGSAAANILRGGPGNDTLSGLDGDDLLDGGPGKDTMNGGAGSDVADYSSRINAVNVSFDGVANDGESGENDVIGADVESAMGGSGADTLTGNALANTFRGGPGTDTLNGGDGDDVLDGGADTDTLNGGSGNDTADYSSRTNPVTFTLDGVANDGESGENDVIGADVESAMGGSGADTLTGNGLANTLNGGAGNDTLNGLEGNDTLAGGAENDVLDGGGAADVIGGGAGKDRVLYSGRTNPVVVTLDGAANDGESAELDNVKADVENITGGSGNDTLTGSAKVNAISGGGGGDAINVRDSVADKVTCGPGTDVVTADFLDTASADCETVNRA